MKGTARAIAEQVKVEAYGKHAARGCSAPCIYLKGVFVHLTELSSNTSPQEMKFTEAETPWASEVVVGMQLASVTSG